MSRRTSVNIEADPIPGVPGVRSAHHAQEGLVPPPRQSWVSPVSDKLLIVLFAMFIAAPFIAYRFGWGVLEVRENRKLAPLPDLAAEPVTSWPAKLEAYYNDRFGLRGHLIWLYNTLVRKYLHASNHDVLLGKDNWLFYAREDIFKDFFGNGLFTDEQLNRWKQHLEDRQKFLARRNAQYLFVIAPDKNTIYPEKLPDWVQKQRGYSRSQQLLDYLKKTGSPVNMLDLHSALLAAKGQGPLYYAQDTHWNGRGYFVGYQAMCAELKRWFPWIEPRVLGRDYAIRSKPWIGGEWSFFGVHEENLKYNSEFLVSLGTEHLRKQPAPFPPELPAIREPWLTPLYWEGPGQKSLLIFHDSFMRSGTMDLDLAPLAEHFSRTLLIGLRPSDREIALITDLFHPDVVIEQRAERLIAGVPALSGTGNKTHRSSGESPGQCRR